MSDQKSPEMAVGVLEDALQVSTLYNAHWKGPIFKVATPRLSGTELSTAVLFNPFGHSEALILNTSLSPDKTGGVHPAIFNARELRKLHPDLHPGLEKAANVEQDLLRGMVLAQRDAVKDGAAKLVIDCTSLDPRTDGFGKVFDYIAAPKQGYLELNVVVAHPLEARVARLEAYCAAQGAQIAGAELGIGEEADLAARAEATALSKALVERFAQRKGIGQLVLVDPWGNLVGYPQALSDQTPEQRSHELALVENRGLSSGELNQLSQRLDALETKVPDAGREYYNATRDLVTAALRPFREQIALLADSSAPANTVMGVPAAAAPAVAPVLQMSAYTPTPTPMPTDLGQGSIGQDFSSPPPISPISTIPPRQLSAAEETARNQAQVEFASGKPAVYFIVGDGAMATDRYLAQPAAKLAPEGTAQPSLVLSSKELFDHLANLDRGTLSPNEPILVKVDPAISAGDFGRLIAQCKESGFRPELQLVALTKAQAALDYASANQAALFTERIDSEPGLDRSTGSAVLGGPRAVTSRTMLQLVPPDLAVARGISTAGGAKLGPDSVTATLLPAAVAAGIGRVSIVSPTGRDSYNTVYDTMADTDLPAADNSTYRYPGHNPDRIQGVLEGAQQRTLLPLEQAQLAFDWANLLPDQWPKGYVSSEVSRKVVTPAAAAAEQVGRSKEARGEFVGLCADMELAVAGSVVEPAEGQAVALSEKMAKQLLAAMVGPRGTKLTEYTTEDEFTAFNGGALRLMTPEHAICTIGGGKDALFRLDLLPPHLESTLPAVAARLSISPAPEKGPSPDKGR